MRWLCQKNAASCFIQTCICGDVLKGENKILIWMLRGNKSGARAQPTLLAQTLSSSGLPSTFGSAGSSATPRPNACRAGEGCMGTSSLWADYLLTGSGIKVYSHFYKVISNLVFLLGRLQWLEEKRHRWLVQSSKGDCNLI